MIDEIEKRVRSTICNTWSNGRVTVEGRISLDDFETLLHAARSAAARGDVGLADGELPDPAQAAALSGSTYELTRSVDSCPDCGGYIGGEPRDGRCHCPMSI